MRARSMPGGSSQATATGRSRKRESESEGGQEGRDRALAEAFADDDTVDVAVIEVMGGGLDRQARRSVRPARRPRSTARDRSGRAR